MNKKKVKNKKAPEGLTSEQGQQLIELLKKFQFRKRVTTTVYKGNERIVDWLERTIKYQAMRLAREALKRNVSLEEINWAFAGKHFLNDSWTDWFENREL